MKSMPYFSALLSSLFILCGVVLSSNALAKNINLYEQPMTTAKVVGTIDLSTGVIPIFTPKGGEWVKIGDPRNGNVGWIKSSDLSSGSTSSFSFTQKVINDGKAPQSYKIEFGNMPTLNVDQTQLMIKKMQTQQQAIEKSAQKVIQEMMNNIYRLYQQQPQLLYDNGKSAVIMPIVIVPASALKVSDPVIAPGGSGKK